MVKPWERYPSIWKTESAFMSWIRGGIRRSLWNRHPVKLEFIKNNRKKIPNPNPRGKVATVWGATCALTGITLPIGQMEVDHMEGGHSLKSLDDLSSFIKGIVLVTEDDLQFVSKEAHKVKSYAESQNISFEDAYAIKKAIAFTKKPVKEVVAFCQQNGYNEQSLTNATKRRQAVEEIFKRR